MRPTAPRGLDEEQRLKASRDLINLQLETNRTRERYEAETFELKRQILALETRECQRQLQAAEVARREPTRRTGRPEEGRHRAPARGPQQPGEAQTQEKSPLPGRELPWAEMERMQGLPGAQRRKLEETLAQRERELREARSTAHSARKQLAEQSAGLLTAQGQLKEVREENSRLQLQLKTLNDEYRGRLRRHLRTLAGFMAGPTKPEQDPGKEPPGPGRALADAMLRDIGVTYQARERQLAGAARTLRRRLRGLLRRHEELLVAYRMQREQILAHGGSLVEPGPPEAHFAGGAGDRQRPASARELGRPREDRARLEARLRELQATKPDGAHNPATTLPGPEDEEHWAELRQQLRDFTRTTQSQLERERSRLLSRALLAEERLAELQDYVDRHLARYQQEIVRLRKELPPGPARPPAAGDEARDPRGQGP